MKKTGIVLIAWLILLLGSSFSLAKTISPLKRNTYVLANVQMTFNDDTLTITNRTQNIINLRNAILQFYFSGNITKISGTHDLQINARLSMQQFSQLPHSAGNFYTVNIDELNQDRLLPGKSIQLKILTETHTQPHGFQLFVDPPVPVQVQVSVANANWVETISICNNSNFTIPLTNIEFDFTYTPPMPTNIWGQPWVAWKLASQQGSQVVLTGGTPWTPALTPDPTCAHPLTIQFNAAPSLPAPTGPFTFKAAGGQPAGYGSLDISVPTAPANGLPNPQISVQGMGLNQQQTVAWGQKWQLNNLTPGSYTVSASPVDNGAQFYKMDPLTVNVSSQTTTPVNIAYQAVPTGQVTITLENAPSSQVPVTFTGQNYAFNRTLSTGSTLTLPVDKYSVTSNISGYSAVATPNPLNVPSNTALTISYQQMTNGRFVGYFQSWTADSQTTDGTKTNLANLPGYVNVVNLAFVKPDAVYQKGSMQYTGTGLEFNYQSGAVLKQSIATLHQRNPGTKVLAAVGGASYSNWNNLNAQAIADFVTDFGLDGVDIDYEPTSTGCALGADNLIHCQIDTAFESFVESLRSLLPRPYWVTVTGWSVAAYGQDQWANAQPQSQYTGMMLPLLRSPAAKDIDMVNVMSYDAGNTYDPLQTVAAYYHYFPGPISMGVEVPPEAWGGHVYTLCQVLQLSQAAKTAAAQHNNTPAGMMLWSIQKVPNGSPSPNNPNAQMMATVICTSLGLSSCNQPLLINSVTNDSSVFESRLCH